MVKDRVVKGDAVTVNAIQIAPQKKGAFVMRILGATVDGEGKPFPLTETQLLVSEKTNAALDSLVSFALSSLRKANGLEVEEPEKTESK